MFTLSVLQSNSLLGFSCSKDLAHAALEPFLFLAKQQSRCLSDRGKIKKTARKGTLYSDHITIIGSSSVIGAIDLGEAEASVPSVPFSPTTMVVYLILALLPLAWLITAIYGLVNNHRQALKLNVPIVYAPISSDTPIWIALQNAFPFIFKIVPFDKISCLRYCRLGWEFHDRSKTHERLGDAWVLVTPSKNWLYVAEAGAAYDIFSRGRDFGRAVWMLGNHF